MNIVIRVQARQAQAALKQTRAAMKSLDGAQVSGARSGNLLAASAGAATGHITKMGNQLQWTGRQLMYNWTLPIVTSGAAITKWALANEAAMTRVKKVYGDADLSKALGTKGIENETDALARSFEALSNRYGVVQSQVINIGADWAAAGASGLALAKNTELTLKAMVLGEMDYESATKALVSIQAQYQLSSAGLADTLAQLNAVENQTGTSMNDLIEAFTRTAGVARNAGIGTGQLAAMIAAIVPAAGSAANGGNALKTIISRLLAPTNEARQVLGMMNINVADAGWQSLTAAGRLEVLAKKYQELSGGQRAAVSSTVASRWQLNKFDVLMEAMVKNHSYYAKALDITSDRTQYLAIAQNELNQVLDSSPQRLKQIGVILQNVGADVIQPFIPMLVGFGNEIRKLGEWFNGLNPYIQKTIGYVLLFVAAIGPIAKYVGSIGTLLGVLGGGFLKLGTGIAFATKGLRFLMIMPFVSVSKGIMGAVGASTRLVASFGGLGTIFTAVSAQIIGRLMGVRMIFGAVGKFIFSTVMLFPKTISIMIWEMMGMAKIGAYGVMNPFKKVQIFFWIMWRQIVAGANVAAFGMGAAFKKVPLLILAGLKRLPMLLLGFLVSPWGIALTAIVTLIVVFRKQLGTVFSRIGDALLAPWNAAMGGFANSASFFNKFIQFLKNVFWGLPVEVQHAMMAVVKVVHDAAMAVYRLFSYLNPFAHHSPSLVENVTKGMAVVVGQFGTLAKIKSPIDSAYANIKRLKDLTRNFAVSQDAKERKSQIDNLAKVAPKAVAVFRELTKQAARFQRQLDALAGPLAKQQALVDGLSNKLDDMNFELDQQQKILDRLQDTANGYSQKIDDAKNAISDFASAPLKGMQAMNDEIFANEQAQKSLQLQMLKIKQAGGGFDDLAGKVASLNGEMEKLQSDKMDAFNAGAGSDITGFYDQQLKAIEGQKKGISEQADSYAALGKQLDELQNKADQLDLEKSLNFDGLTYEIEKLANAQKELSFDEIVKGISEAQAQVALYQPQLDAVNKTIAAQQAIVDGLAASIRPIQDEYDVQNHKLEVMNRTYNQISSTLGDINSAMSDISGKADAVAAAADAAKAAKGGGKGSGMDSLTPGGQAFQDGKGVGFDIPGGKGTGPGREGGLGDQSKLIDQYTKQISDETGKMWDNIDILKPLKDKWAGVKNWASTEIAPAFKPIKDYVGKLFDGIDWLAPFKKGTGLGDFIASVGAEFKKIPGYAQQAWDFLKTLFGDDFIKMFKDTKDAVVNAFKDVLPQIKPLFEELKGLIPIIKVTLVIAFGILVAVIKTVVRLLSRVLPPVIELVGNIIKNLVRIIRGVVKIIVGLFTGDLGKVASGVSDIFKSLVSIVWAALKAVVQVIIGVLDTIFNVVFSFGAAIFGKDSAWGKAFMQARDIVSNAFDETIAIFSGFFDKVRDWNSKIYDMIVGWFAKLYDTLVGHSIVPDLIDAIIALFAGLPGWLWGHVKAAYDKVTGVFSDLWNWVKDKFGGWWGGIVNIFKHPIQSAKDAIAFYRDKIKDVFTALWDWFSNTWIGKKWNTLKDKLLQPMKDAKQVLSDILTGKKSIKSVFEDAVDAIGKTWDTLKDKAKKPIQFIISDVMNNGFIRVFNDFGSHLPGNPHLPNVKGFKTGGNTGPGARDKVAGVVHADEHVFTKKEVKMTPGGHKTLEVVRAAIRAGRFSKNLFDGGDAPAKAMPGYMVGGRVASNGNSGGQVYNPPKGASSEVGGVYKKALNWAMSQRGKPYVFGSAGPEGYDCSGFMAAIQNIIQGKSPNHRRWSTPAFAGNPAKAQGYTRDARAPFMIGVNPQSGKSGHTAGTLLGKNVESSGGVGVRVGGGARGWNNGLFSWHGGFTGGAPDPTGKWKALLGGLKDKFFDLKGSWPAGDDIMNQVGVGAFRETPPAMIKLMNEWIKRAIETFLKSIGLRAKGGITRKETSWVGENGPELMNLKAGTKILSNAGSTKRLAGGVEDTVMRAVTAGMSSASSPIERATVASVSRAVARGERRVASAGGGDRETRTTGVTQNVTIKEMVFPNVRDATDAEDFVRALATVTPGVTGGN